MKAYGSATASSLFVSTLLPQAPRPPSQCVTSPTQALPLPSQVPLVEAVMLRAMTADDAAAADVEGQVGVLGAAAVEVAAAAPAAFAPGAVVDVPKNSAAGVEDETGAAGVVISTRVVGVDVEVSTVVICTAGGSVTAGVVVAVMALS